MSAGNLAATGVPPPSSSTVPQVSRLHGFENRPPSRRGLPPARSFQVEHHQPCDVERSRSPVSPFLVLPGSEGIADIPVPPLGQAVESSPTGGGIKRNGVDPNYQFSFTNRASAISMTNSTDAPSNIALSFEDELSSEDIRTPEQDILAASSNTPFAAHDGFPGSVGEQMSTPVVESQPRKQKTNGRINKLPAAATRDVNAEMNAASPSAAIAVNEKVKKDRKKRKAVDIEGPNVGEGTKRKRAKVAAGKGTEKPFKVYTGPGSTSQESSAASSESAQHGVKKRQ
ncbi:unnamed protein product [Cyclocybe aegerita]|uniref:Uncharacterized protein n=1 Tax=Cyclocybe aegerita TaxID=1973307 RepID=A0A8S0VT23_CYCAE|nr:unnamed protein product [Cyclocybe aegerita]